jgi:transcriptional regulator with XRE-family HTH domain
MISESEINKRIKSCRIEKGMTLKTLAQKAKLTKGYLSRIENSDRVPPLSTLITIANALGVKLSDIFGETEDERNITLVRREDRPIIARNGSSYGYSYFALAHKFQNKYIEPYVIRVPAGLKQCALFQHEGQEMLFMLKGKLKFFYGDREFIVEEGDCLYYDTSIPHSGIPLGNEEVEFLATIYTPWNQNPIQVMRLRDERDRALK